MSGLFRTTSNERTDSQTKCSLIPIRVCRGKRTYTLYEPVQFISLLINSVKLPFTLTYQCAPRPLIRILSKFSRTSFLVFHSLFVMFHFLLLICFVPVLSVDLGLFQWHNANTARMHSPQIELTFVEGPSQLSKLLPTGVLSAGIS